MFRRVVTELAHEDLKSIVLHVKTTLQAPEAAAKFLSEVQRCYARLSNNPLIYTLCNDERMAREGYRRAPIKNYVFVFKVNEAQKLVIVYRFFFGAQDYPNKI